MLSGVAAGLAVLGASWILVRHGRRASISMSGRLKGQLLTATITVHCDGRWRIEPIEAIICPASREHGCGTPDNVKERERKLIDIDFAWFSPPQSAPAPFETRVPDTGRPLNKHRPSGWFARPRFRHLSYRRYRLAEWKCANQKVPRLTVAELRFLVGSQSSDNTSPALDEQSYLGEWRETSYFHRKDVLFGHCLVPDESLTFDHGFIINDQDPTVIGWRVTLEMWVKRWNWWMQPVATDAWTFASTTIVTNPKYQADSTSSPAYETGGER